MGNSFCQERVKRSAPILQQLFVFIILLFFLIPAYIQTPFRVIILLLFNFIILKYKKRKISYWLLLLMGISMVLYKYYVGSFDMSLLMVSLSLSPIYFFDTIGDKLTRVDRQLMFRVIIVSIIGIIIQLCIFRYEGRPNMSYEINQSASYLFLLLLLCDYLNFRKTAIFIFILGFLLLSRLFLLATALFLFLKYFKRHLPKFIYRIPYLGLIVLFSVLTGVFSFWYAVNMSGNVNDTSDSSDRLKTVNDGSNLLRFIINMKVLEGAYEGNKKLLVDGYGDLPENSLYIEEFLGQPHNELIKHIAQYGLVFTIFLLLISRRYYNQVYGYGTAEYIFPIFLYTQFLWVRFTIIPSIEMLFIFYLLTFKCSSKQLT